MTTKVLSTYITGGYTLAAAYNQLDVNPGAGASGGVYSNHNAEIFNEGRLGSNRAQGVVLHEGGEVENGLGGYSSARINGVEIDNAGGSVINEGTISFYGPGVFLGHGGQVINGDDTNPGALISGTSGVGVEGAAGTVMNYGTIRGLGSIGAIIFDVGGSVTNGNNRSTAALIAGGEGVAIVGIGAVTNFGTIEGGNGEGVDLGQGVVRNLGQVLGSYDGVKLDAVGSVTNGSAANRLAGITGYTGVEAVGAATLVNFGTVTGQGGASGDYGAVLRAGGVVTNGSGADTAALISGYVGVAVLGAASGLVNNFGTIEGLGATTAGVTFAAGGLVTNGSGADTAALISGGEGVAIGGTAAGTVNNYGSIIGLSASYAAGVAISGSGHVFNGAAGLIEGGAGVSLATGGVVQNRGTIRGESNTGASGAGVLLSEGGVVSNGYASDRTALISGHYGIFAQGSANVANLGTIVGNYHSAGVELSGGGAVTNGSTRNAAALITGYTGVRLFGVASLANFGTVAGTGGYGVFLDGSGESVTNGAAGHAKATIGGYQGVEVYGNAITVDNFGTISGDGGTALAIYVGSVFLKVEAGSVFQGAVLGNGGSTLDLASGTGTLSGLSGSAVTVSGSMATTTFSGFGTVEVGAGAVFTLTGKGTVLAGQTLAAAGGVLTASGSVANAGLLETLGGTLTVSGAVTGSGSATVNGGTMDFAAAFNQAVSFVSTGTLELAQSQTYTANVTGFSKTGATAFDLVDIGFVSSSEATFAGNSKGGVLTVTDGTHTAHISLKGNYLSSVFVCSSDGHGGTIVVDPKAKAASAVGASPPASEPPPAWQSPPTHPLVAAMAALGATGGVMARSFDAHPARAPLLAAPHVGVA